MGQKDRSPEEGEKNRGRKVGNGDVYIISENSHGSAAGPHFEGLGNRGSYLIFHE